MKKLVMTVVVLAAATVVSAETVTSANIVGYGKVQAADGLQIASMQFDNSESNSLDSIFGDAYPLGTQVLIYQEPGGYQTSTYAITYPPPSYTPTPGWAGAVSSIGGTTACWIKMPSGSSAVENIMNGEVPLADAVTNSVVAGLNLFSYPYPVEMEIQDLGFVPVVGDQIFLYDNIGGYVTINYAITYPPPSYTPTPGWTSPTTTVPVGGGFWYKTTTPATWIASRPFTK